MISDKVAVRFWNNSFYGTVTLPDGTTVELKSDKDITFADWQAKAQAAWDASQIPPEPVKTPLAEYTDAEIKAEAERRKLMTATVKEIGI